MLDSHINAVIGEHKILDEDEIVLDYLTARGASLDTPAREGMALSVMNR